MKRLLTHPAFTHTVAVVLALIVGFTACLTLERAAYELLVYEEHG